MPYGITPPDWPAIITMAVIIAIYAVVLSLGELLMRPEIIKWSKKYPTAVGWYLWKYKNEVGACTCYLDANGFLVSSLAFNTDEFDYYVHTDRDMKKHRLLVSTTIIDHDKFSGGSYYRWAK